MSEYDEIRMETRIAGSNNALGSSLVHKFVGQKILLVCGILSGLLYVAINIVGPMQWEGYSSKSQAFSELIAIGAPSRPLVVWLSIAYGLLIYAFGWGVWRSAGQNRALRVAGCLIAGKEVFGLVVTLFFPIHMRGVEGTLSDTMHIILTVVGVFLCMLPAMILGASALGKRFRIYTIVTILVFIVNNILTFLESTRLAEDQATPWMGVTERILIFGYIVWTMVLAIALLRRQPDSLRLEQRERIVQPEAAANRV